MVLCQRLDHQITVRKSCEKCKALFRLACGSISGRIASIGFCCWCWCFCGSRFSLFGFNCFRERFCNEKRENERSITVDLYRIGLCIARHTKRSRRKRVLQCKPAHTNGRE